MERMAIKGFKSYVNKVDGIIHYYDLKRPSNRSGIVLIYIACCIMAVVFLFPVLWMVCAALKDEQQLWSGGSFFPNPPSWIGMKKAWINLEIGNSYIWSLYECVGAIVCSITLNGLAGYALALVKPRGHQFMWNLCMTLMLIPATGGFVVLYRTFVRLGLNQGQIWPLFLGAGGSPYTIMIFKTFFQNIPKDYIEAARLDGATDVDIFLRIILPLSKPIIAIQAISVFNNHWSNFLMPYLCLLNSPRKTVMVKLYSLTGQGAAAQAQLRASLYTVIPPVIFFCIFQRYIMNNNIAAGVKG
jgi:multiple sugar transport system permease protein